MADPRHMLYVCIFCMIICYVSAQDKTQRSTDKTFDKLPTYNPGHNIAKRGTYPFWVRHRPSVWKRFNHINSIPEDIDEEVPAMAPADPSDISAPDLMAEFVLFLKLKELGILDMCLVLQKR